MLIFITTRLLMPLLMVLILLLVEKVYSQFIIPFSFWQVNTAKVTCTFDSCLYWDGVGANSQVDNAGGSWTIAGTKFTTDAGNTDVAFLTGYTVSFGGPGTLGTAGTVTVTGTYAPLGLNFGSVPSGNFTLSGGTINFPNSTPTISVDPGLSPIISSAMTSTGTLIFDEGAGSITTFSGVYSSTGSLQQQGQGTTMLTGANTYSGTTTVDSGTLQVGNAGAAGSLGAGAVINKGTLFFNYGSAKSITLPPTSYSGDGTLSVIAGGIDFTGGILNISGPFIYNKISTSFPSSSAISITSKEATLSGYILYNGLNTKTFNVDTSASNGTINIDSITSGVAGVYWAFNNHTFNAGSGVINITGTNTINYWSNGATETFIGQVSGFGNINGNAYSGSGGKIIFDNPGSSIYSGSLPGGGIYSFTKNGVGLQVMSGIQTYTGVTTVNAGELQFNAVNTGSSIKTVNSGGIISGSGTIVGDTTISGGGTVRGGIGSLDAGNLTVTGKLIFSAASSMLNISSDGINLSKVTVSGGVTAGSGLVVNLLDPMPVVSNYVVISASGGMPATLPTVGINNSGRSVSFNWNPGNGLRMTLN